MAVNSRGQPPVSASRVITVIYGPLKPRHALLSPRLFSEPPLQCREPTCMWWATKRVGVCPSCPSCAIFSPFIVWIMRLGMYSQLLRSPCCLQLMTNAKSLTFKCPIKHDTGLCDAQQPYRPRVKALRQLPCQPLIWLWHLNFDASIFHLSGCVWNCIPE